VNDFDVREWYDAGRVEIIGRIDPISLQAAADRKARFQDSLAKAVAAATTGVYTGDVEVTIRWFISQKRRYGTHIAADIDNVVKPLLDAVTGPDGVMIDDNQVQSLQVSWLDPAGPELRFEMLLQPLMRDDYVRRAGLTFARFSADRCWPIFGGAQPVADMLVKNVGDRLQAREKLLAAGVAEHDAEMLMPIQRFFPSARLTRFTVRPASDYPLSGYEDKP
jgi:Holliday junction resolvase RusA-like endonuclease